MKRLFIYLGFLMLSMSVFACQNSLPESEVIKAIALVPGAGSKSCADLPKEKCHCYDGRDWETTSLVNGELVEDPEKAQAKRQRLEVEASNKEVSEGKKRSAKERLKNIDWEKSMSTAQLKAVLKDMVESKD
jgi:hypothetical protein